MKAIEAFGRIDASAIVGVLLLLAAGLVGWVARKRPDMRPLAASMAVMAGTALATLVLWSVVEPPKLGDPPHTGWRRVAGHVDNAAYLLQRAAPAVAAWQCCIGRSGRPAWIVAAVLLGGLVATYPTVRGGGSLASYYLAAQVVFLVLALKEARFVDGGGGRGEKFTGRRGGGEARKL